MLELVYNAVFSGYITSFYGLANITIGYFDVFLDYIVVIVMSIIVALILRVPLLPDKPYRYSYNVSAIYPTPIIAIGVFSLFLVLNYIFIYNGVVLAAIIGILSAFFVKYLFFAIFPKPLDDGDSNE